MAKKTYTKPTLEQRIQNQLGTVGMSAGQEQALRGKLKELTGYSGVGKDVAPPITPLVSESTVTMPKSGKQTDLQASIASQQATQAGDQPVLRPSGSGKGFAVWDPVTQKNYSATSAKGKELIDQFGLTVPKSDKSPYLKQSDTKSGFVIVDPATGKTIRTDTGYGQELMALHGLSLPGEEETTAEEVTSPELPTEEVVGEVKTEEEALTTAGIDSSKFEQKREEFITSLGADGQVVNQAITALTEQGMTIDTSNADLQTQVREALSQGATQEQIQQIMAGFDLSTGPTGEAPVKTVSDEVAKLEASVDVSTEHLNSAKEAYNSGVINEEEYKAYLEKHQPSAVDQVVDAGATEEVDYTQFTTPPQVEYANYLNGFTDMSYDGFLSSISSALGTSDFSDTSSAAINQMMLAQMALSSNSEMQKKMSALYGRMAQRAEDAYFSALDNVGVATAEIDNIISGRSTVSTTIESLLVKAAKQQQDIGLTSLEAREAALDAEFEYTFNQMLEQNSRLEGYMKAKLNYMGAAESSSGLSMMASVIDNAQQRLMLYQTKHSAEMVQLEGMKTQLMNDYYNRVQEQLIGLQGQEGAALGAYYDQLNEIEANQLASEAEAQTMTLSTLSNLYSQLYTIETDQRNWEYQLASDAYNRAMQEAEIARDIENQEKAVALDFLDRLIESGAGSTFGQLPTDIQDSILKLTRMVGLPDSYAAQSLQTILMGMRSGGGAGGGISDLDLAIYQNVRADWLSETNGDQSFEDWVSDRGFSTEKENSLMNVHNNPDVWSHYNPPPGEQTKGTLETPIDPTSRAAAFINWGPSKGINLFGEAIAETPGVLYGGIKDFLFGSR